MIHDLKLQRVDSTHSARPSHSSPRSRGQCRVAVAPLPPPADGEQQGFVKASKRSGCPNRTAHLQRSQIIRYI